LVDPIEEKADKQVRMLLLDFYEHNGWYYFRFGHGDDFSESLRMVKSIPIEERVYKPENNHLWGCKVTEENERILVKAFENARTCILALKSQLRMF